LAGSKLTTKVSRPLPRTWKGQRPKEATWKTALKWLGWDFDPTGRFDFRVPAYVQIVGEPAPRAHQKEILDALAIAQWGLLNRFRRGE